MSSKIIALYMFYISLFPFLTGFSIILQFTGLLQKENLYFAGIGLIINSFLITLTFSHAL